MPRKTKIYNFPEWIINHELINHFMRGYFDGDGCFYKVKSNRNIKQHMMSIAGNLPFLLNYSNIINKNLNIDNKNISYNGGINVLTYGGNTLASNVGLFLYKNATIFLDRKHILWKEFHDQYNKWKLTRG